MIWLLFDYEEHGPERLWAFNKFEDLVECAKDYYPDDLHAADMRAELLKRLETVKPEDFPLDENVQLMRGWGGLNVRRVELK